MTTKSVPRKTIFERPPPKFDKQMVQLAEHILDTKAAHFDPAKFKDRYETALKALVKRKAAGKTIEPPEPPAKPGNVVNLMEALKQSLSHGLPLSSPLFLPLPLLSLPPPPLPLLLPLPSPPLPPPLPPPSFPHSPTSPPPPPPPSLYRPSPPSSSARPPPFSLFLTPSLLVLPPCPPPPSHLPPPPLLPPSFSPPPPSPPHLPPPSSPLQEAACEFWQTGSEGAQASEGIQAPPRRINLQTTKTTNSRKSAPLWRRAGEGWRLLQEAIISGDVGIQFVDHLAGNGAHIFEHVYLGASQFAREGCRAEP